MEKFQFLRSYRVFLWFLAGCSILIGLSSSCSTGPYVSPVVQLTSLLTFGALAVSLVASAELVKLFLTVEDHLDEMKSLQRENNQLMKAVLGSKPPQDETLKKQLTAAKRLSPIEPMRKWVRVINEGAFLYRSPAENSIKLRPLAYGERLELLGQSDEGWYSTREGYIKTSDGTTIIDPASGIEHPAAPTAPTILTSLTVAVESESAAVYDKPSEHATLLGRVSRGRTLMLYGRDSSSHWVCEDETGTRWIRVKDLSVSGDIRALPILAPLN